MQDYYYAPIDRLVLEVGRDDWVFDPREDKSMNNLFMFYTWENDGSSSPDKNDYSSMEEFYRVHLNGTEEFDIVNLEKAFGFNDYIYYAVCKNEWTQCYEMKNDDDNKEIIGYLFQRAAVLKKQCRKEWLKKAVQELNYYNQFITRDVFFINSYRNGGNVSFKTNIYNKEKELYAYEDIISLGCYCNIEECLDENPNLGANDADVIEKTDKQQSTLKKLLFIRE